MQVSGPTLNPLDRITAEAPRLCTCHSRSLSMFVSTEAFPLGRRRVTTAGQEASLCPDPPISGSRKSSSICAALASSLPFPASPSPPRSWPLPLPPLVLGLHCPRTNCFRKAKPRRPRRSWKRKTTRRYWVSAGRGGERRSGRERPARGCGLRVLRDPGAGASRSLERSEQRLLLREAGLGAPLAQGGWGAVRVPASGGGCRCFGQDPRLLHHS